MVIIIIINHKRLHIISTIGSNLCQLIPFAILLTCMEAIEHVGISFYFVLVLKFLIP